MSLTGYLGAALFIALAWGGFATERWLTAGARCDTKIAQAERDAIAAEQKRASEAEAAGAIVFASVRSEVRSSLQTAAEATAKRSASIRAAAVAGECRMPALPSLSPAVQEARDAALD